MKPKILLVHDHYLQFGGEDAVFLAEKELLTERGHSVVTYVEDNRRIEEMSKIALASQTIWSTNTTRNIKKIIRDERPDVVHCHNTFPLISPSIYWACRDERLPVVQTLHNYRLICPRGDFIRDGHVCEDCMGKFIAWPGVKHACYHESRGTSAVIAGMLAVHRALGTWRNHVTVFVALSQFARNKLIQGGVPAEKITVSANFVAPDPGVREGAGDYAIYVGRLSMEKGVRTLISAWVKIGNEIPLRILGDGPLRAELEAETQRNGLTNVAFLGRLSRAEVLAQMRGARFAVLPSECYENFPVVVAESFACAVPVVGSSLGSVGELVGDQRTGLHFKTGDAKDLAEKVNWAWTHPAEMEAFGRAGRAEFEEKYTADCKYDSLMKIYARAMSAAPRN